MYIYLSLFLLVFHVTIVLTYADRINNILLFVTAYIASGGHCFPCRIGASVSGIFRRGFAPLQQPLNISSNIYNIYIQVEDRSSLCTFLWRDIKCCFHNGWNTEKFETPQSDHGRRGGHKKGNGPWIELWTSRKLTLFSRFKTSKTHTTDNVTKLGRGLWCFILITLCEVTNYSLLAVLIITITYKIILTFWEPKGYPSRHFCRCGKGVEPHSKH